jgi:hypothetical protein
MIKDLPEPLVNTKLNDEEVDFRWPERTLGIEIDGPQHGRPRSQREDAAKQALLESAGYTVLRLAARETVPPVRASSTERPRRGSPPTPLRLRLEHAIDEAPLRGREKELLEQHLAARIVVDHPAFYEDQLEHAPSPPVGLDRRRRAGLPVHPANIKGPGPFN